MRKWTLVIAMAACAGGPLQKLRAKAAVDFKCETVATEGVPGSWHLGKAHGCGKQNWYIYDGQAWVSPLDRAAFEMSCPPEKLTAMGIDKTTIGVTGCDKKGVYVLVESRTSAKWVLNSTEGRQ